MKQPCAPIKASTGWTSKRSWAVGRSYVTLPQPFWADCRRAATNPATFSHLICPRSFHAQRGGAGLLLPGPQRLLRAIPAPSFTIKNNDHGRSRRPLRQFCISGCVPYLAHMYMYVKYCVLLSVDTCPGHPGGDRPCGRGTPLPGRAMDLPCHRGKGFNSSCLLQLSNTSNIMLHGFFCRITRTYKATQEEEALMFFACSPL